MPIEKFEDIKGWQEARTWVRMIYLLTEEGKFTKDFGLRDQIRRASVSRICPFSWDCPSFNS